MNHNILMVSYYYPPYGGSGTFRSLGFSRNLVRFGWKLSVLTASEYLPELRDNSLLSRLPEGIRIINAPVHDPFLLWSKFKLKIRKKNNDYKNKHKGIPKIVKQSQVKPFVNFIDQMTRIFKTPDDSIGWFFPAVKATSKISLKPDVIYSSAPPFTSHLVGLLLKSRWKVPLVTDFRDPWIDNPFRVYPGKAVDWWDRFLEKLVFKKSDLIIANTSKMAELFKYKYPYYINKICMINNGFDYEDFVYILPQRDEPKDCILLIHPGTLYGKRNPLKFLHALKRIIGEGYENLRIKFIGKCEQFENKDISEHVVDMGLEQHVKISPPVSRDEILSLMKGADGLLLFSQGTTLQVPAKLFEYLALDKPVIAIGEKNSATEDIVGQLSGNHFWAENAVDDIACILKDFCSIAGISKDIALQESNCNFERGFLTKQLSDHMEKIIVNQFNR